MQANFVIPKLRIRLNMHPLKSCPEVSMEDGGNTYKERGFYKHT